jgi:hypothetical protein
MFELIGSYSCKTPKLHIFFALTLSPHQFYSMKELKINAIPVKNSILLLCCLHTSQSKQKLSFVNEIKSLI